MFAVGDRVIYMKSHPWNAGGWWTDYPAIVLGQSAAGRIRLQLENGKKVAVKCTSIRRSDRVSASEGEK